MKCGVWEFNENAEMSVVSDDAAHLKLKSIAELPVECSIVYVTIYILYLSFFSTLRLTNLKNMFFYDIYISCY